MALTYQLIQTITVGSSVASVAFTSIPQTYTDIVVRASVRDTTTSPTYAEGYARPNDASPGTFLRTVFVRSTGTTAGSSTDTTQLFFSNSNQSTSNTFSIAELYQPSYKSSSINRQGLFLSSTPNANSSTLIIHGAGVLYLSTSAINSYYLYAQSNFVAGTTFYLYGISNTV
jgi:hypothetical protein